MNPRKTFFPTIAIILCSLLFWGNANSQTLERTFYFDFGSQTPAVNPDDNGHYWNDINNPATSTVPFNIVGSTGSTSNVKLQITNKFTSNNAGGLASPSAVLLNDLAVATATQDYFFAEGGTGVSASLKLKNLNPQKKYRFTIFGSRADNGVRTAQYNFIGLTTTSKTLQTTGSGVGAGGENYNTANIAVSELIYPDINGDFVLEVVRQTGSYAHINCMKLEEFGDVPAPEYSFVQKLYVDFGATVTAAPDNNNNYWNNMTASSVGTTLPLVNSANAATNYSLSVTQAFVPVNTSPGALASPTADMLGDFGIATATSDYFFVGDNNTVGTLKLSGLDAEKTYKFYIFGSRSETSVRIGQFTFSAYNTVSLLHQTSGANIGGTGVNQNAANLLVTEPLRPDVNGEISIELSRHTASYAHLNAMRIDEYTAPAPPDPTSLTVSGSDIAQIGGTSQLTAEVLPSNALYQNIAWTLDDQTVAWIDSEGILHPKKNGSVVVTATANYTGGNVSNTKTVNITNQIDELYIAGSATESGSNAVKMHPLTDKNQTATGIFETFIEVNNSGDFNFYSENNILTAQIYGGASNILTQNGAAIAPATSGIVRVTANLQNGTYEILPITALTVVGSCTPNDWTVGSGLPINYQGNGVWQETLTLDAGTSSDPPRLNFIINNSWSYKIAGKKGTENEVSTSYQSSSYGIELADIATNRAGGDFLVTLDLRNYTYAIECVSINDTKITVIGSSVPNGQGATNMHGYTWLYGQLLQQRYNNFGSTNNFQTSNVCVNGNSTVDVLARWKADFINNCGKYALLALSLGNEGIHENGQPSFDSYRDNLQLMIAEARNADKIPVVTNSYTRGDFNATDYEFIKAINLLIHEWNVPSVNLLGAIDNGAGVWADNYWSGDIYHPNDAGHAELFHALVPSLFDALEINKPIPTVKTGTSYTFNDVDKKGYLQFTPEDVIHSFTISFDVKTSNSGTVASFDAGNATIGKIEINADGNLVYSSPISGNITSSSVINNNAWHKITLTHYYAWGKTMLYIDDALVNTLSEQILATNFYLNGKTDFPTTADYRNLLFYRSAMNIDEVEALAAGSLLKSSLEIYAPLDEAETYGNKFSNYAQSLNTVQFVSLSPTAVNEVSDNKLIIFPNPATDKLQISAPKSTGNDMQILDIAGKIISTFHISNSIDISSLSAGIYFVKIDNYLAKFIKK